MSVLKILALQEPDVTTLMADLSALARSDTREMELKTELVALTSTNAKQELTTADLQACAPITRADSSAPARLDLLATHLLSNADSHQLEKPARTSFLNSTS